MDKHGTTTAYKRGCKCGECRAAWAAYMRDYTARNKERVAANRAAAWRKRSPEQIQARRDWLAEYMRTNGEQQEKRNERRRRYREDPEYRERERQQQYINWTRDPSKRALAYRKHLLKKKYGLTLDQFDELLASQHGACAICLREQVGMRLHIDHDHSTGKIRGLLCSNCNTGLGMFGDSVDGLIAAIQYLEEAA